MIPHFAAYPQDYLRDELRRRQERRPHYSLRAFARDLEMSPSSLCEFLAGRQGLSKARAIWISNKLNLNSELHTHFWDLIESKFGRSPTEKEAAKIRAQQRVREDRQRLSLDRFRAVADWYHFALLELLGLEIKPLSQAELQMALGISAIELKAGLKRLKALGLVIEDGNNYRPSTDVTLTGDDGADEAIRQCHRQTLLMQSDAVESKSIQQRESLSISMSISQSDWPEFRRSLKDAVMQVATRFSSSQKPKDQVINLALQAITLLEGSDNGKN